MESKLLKIEEPQNEKGEDIEELAAALDRFICLVGVFSVDYVDTLSRCSSLDKMRNLLMEISVHWRNLFPMGAALMNSLDRAICEMLKQ